ncbi:GAF domain-containing sensor histidine kinase [Actinoplanes sp. N902-109]|uniref:GAF domain-containing sensor histidine kinase n=1 Tax=Actinoplanes sp. (strain N902-109) TaxID=649831 RepID=UPI000329484B|nr:GAF domain-containing sensor histidine kinase [Actinoplanes sp. N902-109]AGL21583.1 histidine kinase response regulator hybrid protein [Actinoplanes sp. N902-109]
MRAPPPENEAGRLAALHEARVLDTLPEEDFDDIALLASEICGTPIGLVTLIAEDRQWFKAKVGLDLDGAHRDVAFCSYVVHGHDLLEVPDTQVDPRFHDNPLVTGDDNFRFYAGAPVILDGTHAVGTVCVIDNEPRELTTAQRRALRSLARHASVQLELRKYARHAGEIADRMRQLDRMKDSFLASVSHELRTPLASIRGYLEMLLEDELDADTSQRFLLVMQRNSDRLLRLIDDLLTVARLHDDGLDLDLAEVDLAELAHQVVLSCRPLAEHREVKLRDRTASPVHVRGDAKRLNQALNHLIVNALKFTAPGGEIAVTSTNDGEPELTITDTGVGIPAGDLPHVFDRFFRSASADTMAVPGPGIGLAIVRSIIDAHHGSIHLDSEPGIGTTVRLILPRP